MPVFGASVFTAVAAGQTYTITEIPPVQENPDVIAAEINDNGVVVGTSSSSLTGSDFWGLVYQPGVGSARINRFFQGDIQPSGSYGRAINSSGGIAGSAALYQSGFGRAIFTTAASPSVITNLGAFPRGGDSDAWGINDAGVIVGFGNFSTGGGGPFYAGNPGLACRWTGAGTITGLATLGGYGSIATGINNDGDIIGIDAFQPNPNLTNTRSFLLPGGNGPAIELTHPFVAHGGSRVFKIKNSGVILGFAHDAAGITKPVMWRSATTPVVLATLPGLPHATALDALPSGTIAVGTAGSTPLNNGGNGGIIGPMGGAAMLYVRGKGITLNSVVGLGTEWNLRIANGVNIHGVIAGSGDHGAERRAFVLHPCGPLIYEQPTSLHACGPTAASFNVASVSPVDGQDEPTTVRWMIESPHGSGAYVALIDPSFTELATGLSFTATGAATPGLTVTNVRLRTHAPIVRFVVELTNACGTVRSMTAELTACPADFNCDGFLDFFDYDAFVECFETEACGGGTADFNADGFVDFFDYDDFVAAFEAGC